MGKLIKKVENINKMLKHLESSLQVFEETKNQVYNEYIRDSVISRYKILVDYTWKAIKVYLEKKGFVDMPANPRDILMLAFESKFLNKDEHDLLLNAIFMRNTASHIYDEYKYLLVLESATEILGLIKNINKRFSRELLIID